MIKKWQQEFLNISLKILKKYVLWCILSIIFNIFTTYIVWYSENMKLIFRGPNWASMRFDAETDI